MIYYELIERAKSHTNNFIPVTELKSSPRDYQAYCSLFGYDQSIIDFIKLHNTVSGYNGAYYLQTFYFDIDCKGDLQSAKDSAIELIRKLNIEYKVNPNHLIIYFSGGKGFHIGMYDKMFGGFKPSNELPDQTKSLGQEMAGKIPNIDFIIYSRNRFFRLPNSKHAESGLYKIPMSFQELSDWTINDVIKNAKKPRLGFLPGFDYKEILTNPELESLWVMIKNKPADSDLKRDYVQKESVLRVPEDGERNNVLFGQTIKIFKNSTLKFDDVLKIMAMINRGINPPLGDQELLSLVRSAERYREEQKETEKKDGYKFFQDYIDQWLEYMSPTKRKLTLCFESIDQDLKYKLDGKLIALMGKGGSKKTIYTENIVIENISQHGARCIYSQMDMGDLELISRYINHIGDAGDISISESLEIQEKSNPGFAKEWLEDEPTTFYSDKLIITSQSNMTAKDYDKMIEDITRKHGKVDFLFVDSISKMGGFGGDTERYSKNTKELKELTIKWGVCVVLVCHVVKSCEKHYRDCSRYVRGTEKILDDCDLQISISQIIDEANADGDSPQYINEKGIIQTYNKRGTGKTIRRAFDFNPIRLLITESNDDPYIYEYKTKTEKQSGLKPWIG